MTKSRSSKPSEATSFLRIIGGEHRGRKLPIPNLQGLRPTSDRIRETVFNWLQFDVRDRRVLDLFAGTGALGLEALSRGAQHCLFIEPQAAAAKTIELSLSTLKLARGRVQCSRAEQVLQTSVEPFDLVFVDPPFSLKLWQTTLEFIEQADGIGNGALIYVECPKQEAFSIPSCFDVIKDKTAGNVRFRLLEKQC